MDVSDGTFSGGTFCMRILGIRSTSSENLCSRAYRIFSEGPGLLEEDEGLQYDGRYEKFVLFNLVV